MSDDERDTPMAVKLVESGLDDPEALQMAMQAQVDVEKQKRQNRGMLEVFLESTDGDDMVELVQSGIQLLHSATQSVGEPVNRRNSTRQDRRQERPTTADSPEGMGGPMTDAVTVENSDEQG